MVNKYLKCYIIETVLFMGISYGYAQTSLWTLEKCIEYAINNNLQLKKYENSCLGAEIQLNTAKYARLPSVSANSNQNFDFGRTISDNNTYINQNIQRTDFSIGGSVPIFSRFQIPNNIEINKYNQKAVKGDLQAAKESLRVQVTSAYFQTLCANELCNLADYQIMEAKKILHWVDLQFGIGIITEAEVLEAKSRIAQFELKKVQAENNYQLSLLSLCQLMEVEIHDSIKIEKLDSFNIMSIIPIPETIYCLALSDNPNLYGSKARLRAAEKNYIIARSAYLPSLDLTFGLSTRYYHYSNLSHNQSFGEQLKKNTNKYVGINLCIPLFNRFATRNNVRGAKIAVSNQIIEYEECKMKLLKEIQEAYYNAVTSKKQLEASDKAMRSAEYAKQTALTKYHNGKISLAQFNDINEIYIESCSTFFQSKYEYVYRYMLLKYYTMRINT